MAETITKDSKVSIGLVWVVAVVLITVLGTAAIGVAVKDATQDQQIVDLKQDIAELKQDLADECDRSADADEAIRKHLATIEAITIRVKTILEER